MLGPVGSPPDQSFPKSRICMCSEEKVSVSGLQHCLKHCPWGNLQCFISAPGFRVTLHLTKFCCRLKNVVVLYNFCLDCNSTQQVFLQVSSSHAAWTRTCSTDTDMQHGHGHAARTRTCSTDTDMQHGHGHAARTRTCSTNTDMQHGYGHAARTRACSMHKDMGAYTRPLACSMDMDIYRSVPGHGHTE
jgi:hypothetical protein